MADIQFATNQELIEELTSRNSFVGMVVISKDEHRDRQQCHSEFVVVSRCGSKKDILWLLNRIKKTLPLWKQE